MLSARPIDTHSFVGIGSAHRGAIRGDAAHAFSGKMDDGFRSGRWPAFCRAVDRIGDTAAAKRKRLAKKIAVSRMENYHFPFTDAAMGVLTALHILDPDE